MILNEEDARAVMLAADFQPNVPYQTANTPWAGVCLKCGQPGSPTYSNVRTGRGACAYCAVGQKVDSAVLVGKMLAADFQPNVPYQNSVTPWAGVCLKCGQPGSPTYASIQQGTGACGYCARIKADPAIAFGKMLAADFQPSAPYQGAHTPWAGVCLKCGHPGSPVFANIHTGQGACTSCGGNGFNPAKSAIVYVVASSKWVKVGITNTASTRLSKHAGQGLTNALHILEFESGHDAAALERLWLEFKATLPTHMHATKDDVADGYTETVALHPSVLTWIDQNLLALAS